MKKLWVVTKNELLRYFISPLAYVYLVAFLLLNGSFAIYFGHFIGRGLAGLDAMFAFQPWLYLLFIPGISMRLWAEEFRSKTVVQLLTMPVSVSTLVWGKFFASWIFAAVALALTFPFWLTVNYLGSPDNGVILLSYVGSWVLAGCMLAISQTMSALTKNQVIALVLAVIVNFLFFLSGVEYVLGFFRMFAPAAVVDMVASFSFLVHFGTITGGLLELRDIVFFISIIFLFNVTTILAVSFRTSGTSRWLKSTEAGYYVLFFLLLLTAFVGLNLTANRFLRMYQYDFTEEKLHTLTPSSRRVLEDLPEPVIAKLYYSPILGERSPEMRLMYDRVRLLLEQFARLQPDKFSYKIYNPQPLDDIEDQAIAAGLQPLPLVDLNQNSFFGLVLSDGADRHRKIPFFALERYGYLEQDLIELIYQLYHKKKTLGLISSLPVFDTPYAGGYVSPKWNIMTEIEKFYDVKIIGSADDLSKIDLLMMVHPQKLPDDVVEAIKHYSELGGKTFLLLDTAAEAPRIFSPDNIEFYPSNLNGLDKFWGFRFYNELVVADLDNSITVDATKNYSTNPIFTQDVVQFVAPAESMNPDFPITKNLQGILFASVSAIVPEGNRSAFLPLIKGGDQSGVLSSGVVYDGKNPAELLGMFKPDGKLKFLSALLIENNSKNPYEVIVAADTDFIYDTFWSTSRTILENTYFIPLYDNANFVLNALDYLAGEDVLIPLRGRTQKIRRFEGIEKMRKENLREFRVKENDIFKQIDKTKQALAEVFGKKEFEERENFTSDELAVIAGTRQKLEKLRIELAAIRTGMHRNIEEAGTVIKFINIYLVPLLLLAGLAFVGARKSFRQKKTHFKIVFNREFKVAGTIAVLLLVMGGVSFYLTESGGIDQYENKPVFEGLTARLNDVEKISLSSAKNKLVFYKDNGEWRLEGSPCLPVYQERISSFLTVLANAVYYEKKSDKAEYLSRFGLMPASAKNSTSVEVRLEGNNKEVLADFVIGKYDIDVGRGARAAYMRFADKFQVWMIKADLIDLSTTVSDWTYSTLWNLRFGRLSGFDRTNNLNRTAELVKHLLNTGFESAAEGEPRGKEVMKLDLNVEGNKKIGIDFRRDQEHIFLRYVFSREDNAGYLGFFAKTAEKCYYEISKEKFEKIKDVVESSNWSDRK